VPEDERPPRRERIKTEPLGERADGVALRDALQDKLRERIAPSLVVLVGPDVGVRVQLLESLEVGRDPEAGLALRDDNISWRHLRIEDRGNGDWALVDLGSTNGTRVNEKKVHDAILRPGDRLMLGKTVLEYQVHDALRERFTEEVQRLLHHDDLTGLWVKRRFDAQLESSVAAVNGGAMDVLSVLVMDLDGVKQINDTHGHHMGAFTIASAGKIIGETLGTRGFATRFGGDEYAAALPRIAKSEAVELAETLRLAVTEHVYERGGIRVHPGMSVGVAAVPDDARTAEEVFRAADEAMYRAKKNGKNRVAL
jgi:two-component system cell cycle response regulator